MMESYVTELLKKADLMIVTKKDIRAKYREHVGRELTSEEKSKINNLVYAFVKELSAVVQQEPSMQASLESPVKTKDDSPSNKENKHHDGKSSVHLTSTKDISPGIQESKKPAERSSKFIIKGHVVDKKDLYKPKVKEQREKKKEETAHSREREKRQESVSKTKKPAVEKIDKERAKSAKLKINEVMTAVLGSAQDSSSEVSSVSSLTDTSLSESEEEGGEQVNEALERLKAAREKKIQMSMEKKTKDKNREKSVNKARKSLSLGAKLQKNNSKNKKVEKSEEDSDVLSLISLDSTASEKGRVSEKIKGRRDADPSLTPEKKFSELDSDSGEIRLNRTPQKYAKHGFGVSDKSSSGEKEKKRKLVKRKKKPEVVSDSDSDSDIDESHNHRAERKQKVKDKEHSAEKNAVKNRKDVFEIATNSDSENETLNIIAARKDNKNSKVAVTDRPSVKNLKKSRELNEAVSAQVQMTPDEKLLKSPESSESGDTPLAQLKKKNNLQKMDSGSDGRGTPVKKNKKTKKSLKDDSFSSTGDTPLKKKQEQIRKSSVESDSEVSETGDTPLKKKQEQIRKQSVESASEASETGNTPLIKKKKLKTSAVSSSSEKRNKIGDQISKNTEKLSASAKRKRKLSDSSNQSKDHTKPSEKSSKTPKRKRTISESSTENTGDTALSKVKKARMGALKSSDKGSDSDSSASSNKLVSKKEGLRKEKNVQKENKSKSTSENGKKEETAVSEPGETTKEIKDDVSGKLVERTELDTKVEKDTDEIDGAPEKAASCDTNTDKDSPLKKVKAGHKLQRIESSSEDEAASVKMPPSKKKSRGMNSTSGQVNGTATSVDKANASEMSGIESDDSDDVPLAKISANTDVKSKVEDMCTDSEDDIPLCQTKAAQRPLAKYKKDAVPLSDQAYLRFLRQICRECQMFVRNDRELADCSTDQERIAKLEQMLRDVGMKGKPSMKKAEEVRLMKEAKELSADNIISSETGRVMRKVRSVWARRTISPVKPLKTKTSDPFKGLKDVVDDEGESDSE